MARVPTEPFVPEPGMAYIPVGGCHSCVSWDQRTEDGRSAVCHRLSRQASGESADKVTMIEVDALYEMANGDADSAVILNVRTRFDFGCVQWEKREP